MLACTIFGSLQRLGDEDWYNTIERSVFWRCTIIKWSKGWKPHNKMTWFPRLDVVQQASNLSRNICWEPSVPKAAFEMVWFKWWLHGNENYKRKWISKTLQIARWNVRSFTNKKAEFPNMLNIWDNRYVENYLMFSSGLVQDQGAYKQSIYIGSEKVILKTIALYTKNSWCKPQKGKAETSL